MINKISTKDYCLCLLSGIALVLAFPLAEWWMLAWIGFVPMLFSLEGKSHKQSFLIGYLCGTIFFTGTLCWLFNITRWFSVIAGIGVVLLILYLSLYFGLFALFYCYCTKSKSIVKLLIVPSAWVVLEFTRANLFSGFSWGSLGLSQYKVLPIIQIADISGMYGVSFLIVMSSVAIKEILSGLLENKILTIIAPFSVIILCLHYGNNILSQDDSHYCKTEIAVVQANIAQDDKWNHDLIEKNLFKHIVITEDLVRKNSPDLVIWPETSLPGILNEEKQLPRGFEKFLGSIKTPLLSGVVTQEGERFYNSSILLSEGGRIEALANKIHLVPFGEFVPFRKFIPLLDILIPIDDFSSGEEYAIFSLPQKNGEDNAILFSVLVCFEDAVPSLVRKFVNKGASFLVNITNDAWFGDSSAPFLHLQSSVFRAVENRRSILRAANTGVSGHIDENGAILRLVQDENGKKSYVSGYLVSNVCGSDVKTFYTKFGDVFAYLCFGCILIFIGISRFINIERGGKDGKQN